MAFVMGEKFVNLSLLNLITPFAMILGFLIVFAEPAISILTNEVEEITEGSISSTIMKITISLGVCLAIFLSINRMLTKVSIIYYLIPSYLLAFILMYKSPKIFTSLAFDAGGCVCGPLTATFILPLVIGVCYTTGGNILTDAFGLIAFIAASPFITVELLGIIFRIKTKVEIYKDVNEEIVEYDWRSYV